MYISPHLTKEHMKSTIRMDLLVALIFLFTCPTPATTICSIEHTRPVNLAPDIPLLPSLPLDDDLLCGDVNMDDQINVLDIISMVNFILGGSPDPFNEEAADINADGNINVLDIIGLVNIILETPDIPCPCVPAVDMDGQTYTTVKIGEQCWFRENLNVGILIDGTIEQSNNGQLKSTAIIMMSRIVTFTVACISGTSPYSM